MNEPEVPGGAGEVADLDGRHRRSQRSRERILSALERAVGEEGDVTAEAVAARAGVSLSTVFRHFGDMAGLEAAMRARVEARVVPLMQAGPFRGPTRARARELLRRRSRIFEILAPFRRHMARAGLRSFPEAESERLFEATMRSQISEALAPELAAPGVADLFEVLVALLSFETWERMRRVQGLGERRAAELLEDALMTILEENVP